MKGLQGSKLVHVLPPGALLDDASGNTTEVDTAGWDYATYIVGLGASDVAVATLAVTQSDTAGSGHGNITGAVWGTATDIDGNTAALPSATDDNKLQKCEIDLRGKKRYLDLTLTAGNGTTGTYMTAVCVLTRGDESLQTSAAQGTEHTVVIT